MKEDIVSCIQQHFIEKGWTLSLAESCTGGQFAARLTQLSGCSRYFLGSIVAYSNILKIKVLGVDSHVLEHNGAVSEAVVCQMAKNVMNLTGSDYSLAVSGIAGPGGGTKDKPIGTVWAAIAKKDQEPMVWKLQLHGTRREIMEQCVEQLLVQLWSTVKAKSNELHCAN